MYVLSKGEKTITIIYIVETFDILSNTNIIIIVYANVHFHKI